MTVGREGLEVLTGMACLDGKRGGGEGEISFVRLTILSLMSRIVSSYFMLSSFSIRQQRYQVVGVGSPVRGEPTSPPPASATFCPSFFSSTPLCTTH